MSRKTDFPPQFAQNLESQTDKLEEIQAEEKPKLPILNLHFTTPVFGERWLFYPIITNSVFPATADPREAAFHPLFPSICLSSPPAASPGWLWHREPGINVLSPSVWAEGVLAGAWKYPQPGIHRSYFALG